MEKSSIDILPVPSDRKISIPIQKKKTTVFGKPRGCHRRRQVGRSHQKIPFDKCSKRKKKNGKGVE